MKLKLVIVLLLLLIFAFRKKESTRVIIPNYFPSSPFPAPNALDPAKLELGRVLFYDPSFSADGLVSCASCHSPYNAFAHTDHALSHGVFDSVGTRNAPALFNLAWQQNFMHDGAAHNLEAQALAPLLSVSEMGSSPKKWLDYLKSNPLYEQLFFAAYQDSSPQIAYALEALSVFQLSLVSCSSRYDEMRSGTTFFSKQEQKGYQLYQSKCSSCHQEPLFSNDQFKSNGLIPNMEAPDSGRFLVTRDTLDIFKFKVPSLRNLAYTYPYMHDGRFSKLRHVLNHYSPKRDSLLLDSPLTEPLSENDKSDLLSFLKTLNDPSFVFNPSHAFPKWTLSYNLSKP
jgi:cytochrome c peroxidase